MIDLNLLREEPEKIKELIARKEPTFDVKTLCQFDEKARLLRVHVETLRKEKNELASLGAKGATSEVREKAIALGKELKVQEAGLEKIEQELKALWYACPNIPQPDLPLGGKEANQVVRTFGDKRLFTFTPKNHLELNEKAHWFDFHAGASMAGAQFVFYHEQGTKLIYALTQLMLKNNVKHGFRPVLPPTLITEKGLYNASNLPKFAGDYYAVAETDLNLIPTAEVSLTNLHANQILSAEQLPLRYTAWTSCFRKEAGGYGATERGLIRIHQFEKVELYALVQPEDSAQELERMVACGETLLKALGLHYRVSLLAAQDCSFPSAKTYDIEVWLPGQQRYYEVSSCSNCTDFQARRSGIRYRKSTESKPHLVHTLNASSLALPRLMVALMETYQQEDGSIVLPDVLQEQMKLLW